MRKVFTSLIILLVVLFPAEPRTLHPKGGGEGSGRHSHALIIRSKLYYQNAQNH